MVYMIWVRTEYLVELDDVRVSQDLQDTYLARDPFDVGLLHDFLFLQGLDGHLRLRGDVHPQSHLAERALSDCLS